MQERLIQAYAPHLMEASDDEILERLGKNSTSSNKSRLPKIGRNNSRPSFMKTRGPIEPVQLTSEDRNRLSATEH